MEINAKAENAIKIKPNEINFISEQFKRYRNNYKQVKDSANITHLKWVWAKDGFLYNFKPLEIERSGYKKGKKLKSKPSKSDNTIAYSLDNNDSIKAIIFYSNNFYPYAEEFIINDENRRLIKLSFEDDLSPKTLCKIHILELDDHSLPKQGLFYETDEDNEELTIYKEVYIYNASSPSIIEIRIFGFIDRSGSQILIDEVFYVDHINDCKLNHIRCKTNNLENSRDYLTKIYPT
ncbi:MAG: hypothetical protein DDT31_01594 [Syntrophomonadaceae bacterium]|nr:hypothetical protein [Bacillota bacterium]